MSDQKSYRMKLGLRERRSLLLTADLITGYLALGVALVFWAANAEWLGFSLQFFIQRVPPWFYFLPMIWPVLLVELYDINRAADWPKTYRSVAASALIGLALYSLVYISTDPRSMPRIGVAVFIVAASILTLIWRFLYIRIFTAPQFMRRVLLVGAGRAGSTILKVTSQLNPRPFDLVGVIDDDPEKVGTEISGHKIIAGSDLLLEIADREHISDIIVAISGEMHGTTFQKLLDAQESGVEITRMPVIYEDLLGRVPIQLLEADWLLRSFVDDTRASAFYDIGKRLLDILGGLTGVLILGLMLPFVGIAILLDDGWPIFYSQTRLGKSGRPYEIIKFRTMIKEAEADGKPQWAKEDDERATRVGRILRKTRLDEWPQFINVLRGEMSLVGPRSERPVLIEHFQKHVPFYRARLLVKPGITGWAQINFDYAASIEETIIKLEYDLFYIKRRNLWLDLIILLRTPGTMLGMRGQ